MEVVATFFGYPVTVNMVHLFLGDQVVPIIMGPLGSWLTDIAKQMGLVNLPSAWQEKAKTLVMRGIVACVCLVLNLGMLLMEGRDVSVNLVWMTLLSYLSAVTKFEHSQKAPAAA